MIDVRVRIIPNVTASGAFRACAFVNQSLNRRSGPAWKSSACVSGKNPRKAIGGALRKIASSISKRSGAFAGFAGYSKSNRKSRRTRRASKRY
jgi:hypothetical protein